VVKVQGDQYVIVDTTTGQRVGLAAGTRKRAEREAAIFNDASPESYEATIQQALNRREAEGRSLGSSFVSLA
jgi:hypothetical protein